MSWKSEVRSVKCEGDPGVPLRSADFQSAVSPNYIRQRAQFWVALWNLQPSADCKSAIQQSATLRYGFLAAPFGKQQ